MSGPPILDSRLAPPARRFGDPSDPRLIAYGFVYWVVIVTALEPGNIVNWLAAGASPRWGQELLRILGAGLLGSVTVPIFVRLARRFPISSPRLRRNALVHLACAAIGAMLLIVAAHGLASWLFDGGRGMTVAALRDDLAANELLLFVGLVALSGLAHFVPSISNPANAKAAVDAISMDNERSIARIETVELKVRGLTRRLPVADIDWIEAQGNYLALHVGGSIFLLRETLAGFQARLDPTRFVRIHRRTIIAVDRVTGIDPAANGDGVVRLRDSQALKVSRLHRKALTARIAVQRPAAFTTEPPRTDRVQERLP